MLGFRCAYGLVVIFLTGMVAGCGQPNCSRTFVSEFNSVQRTALTARFGNASRVRQAATDFKTKYAGVKCQANVRGSIATVDADLEMNRILDDIKNLP